MKKVFTAEKGSYGTGFFTICNSLDELKKAIVSEYYQYGIDPEDYALFLIGDASEIGYGAIYSNDMYSEEIFLHVQENGQFTLYEIDLHDEEEIQFGEYDGQSWSFIVKKEPNILSTTKLIK